MVHGVPGGRSTDHESSGGGGSWRGLNGRAGSVHGEGDTSSRPIKRVCMASSSEINSQGLQREACGLSLLQREMLPPGSLRSPAVAVPCVHAPSLEVFLMSYLQAPGEGERVKCCNVARRVA
jgi:hypothetical protein